MPAAFIDSTSLKWMPSIRSMVSTRLPTSSRWTTGTRASVIPSLSRIERILSMLSASRRKSISSWRVRAKSSATARGDVTAVWGMRSSTLAYEQQGPQVGPDLRLQTGTLHLHHHLGAVEQGGAVHLADGGGSDRHLVEAGERRAQRSPQVLLDDAAGGGGREGRYPVSKGGQLGGPLGRKQPRAGGDHLAQLDERGPGIDESVAHPAGERVTSVQGVAPERCAEDQGPPGDPASVRRPRGHRCAPYRRPTWTRAGGGAGGGKALPGRIVTMSVGEISPPLSHAEQRHPLSHTQQPPAAKDG